MAERSCWFHFCLSLWCLRTTSVLAQSQVSLQVHHSGIPTSYPNPYATHHNHSGPQNHTWANTSVPNTPWSDATDSNDNYESAYSPARPPAVPLAVRSPYTSAWSSTANNGSLNSNPVVFWDGSALGWEGIVTVDGISYEWMGVGSRDLPELDNFVPATPLSVAYDSQYSNFTIAAGPMEIVASFFSPVTPNDLCRTSIPLSYLTVNARSMDGADHDVTLYTDINGAWVTQPAAPLQWSIYENQQPVNGSNVTDSQSALYTWIIQLKNQYVFGENYGQDQQRAAQGVFPQWGNFTWTSSRGSAESIRFQSGYSVNQRFRHVNGRALDNVRDTDYRAYDEQEPVFAFEHQLGKVGPAGSGPVVFTVGHVVQPAVRFLSSEGVESLQPWWSRCYGDLFSMVDFHWNDLDAVGRLGASFESKLKQDINKYYGVTPHSNSTPGSPYPNWYNGTNGTDVSGVDQFGQQYTFNSDTAYGYLEPSNGCDATGVAIPDVEEAQAYYSIVALAARQIMGGYVLTVPSVTSSDQSAPFAFQKEISSNGNANTVDVIFPAMPFFLWSNPDFLRYVLDPLFINQESRFYPNSYSMHDLGTHFPNATGHVEGDDEYMPVEESGNMIIMMLAIYRLTNNTAYLQQHYPILRQWASYLVQYSLVPEVQLSTDDFAGQLANQSNLAIKGIVGLAAMAEISSVVGNGTAAADYSQTATNYYDRWEFYAIDPSGRHALLAYQWRSSWGLLYNIYPAKLLALSVIPQSLYDMQSAWYPTVSQIWGVPLDSRHYWTKSDWELWTAAYCQPSTRRLFVNALAYWLNTTSSALPFTDLYQTVHEGESPMSPEVVEFIARPVQGGLYSLLALVAAGTN